MKDSATSKYNEIKLIGKGAYGSVYLVKDSSNGTKYAVKRLMNPLHDQSQPRIIQQSLYELELLTRLNHPNILKLKEAFVSPENRLVLLEPAAPEAYIYTVLEYYPYDLRQLIYSSAYLFRHQVRKIMYDIMCGLNYLHARKVLHRDMKPGNVLGNHRGNYCLCDFSLSRGLVAITDESYNKIYREDYGELEKQAGPVTEDMVCDSDPDLAIAPPKVLKIHYGFTDAGNSPKLPDMAKNGELTGHVTSRWYRAPEIILAERYFTAADVWGAGCIFAELLQTIKEVRPEHKKRRPLFMGKSCFPLSPLPKDCRKEEIKDGKLRVLPDEDDQLSKIVQVLGQPSEDDKAFIKSPEARAYLEEIQADPPIGLDRLLPRIDDQERDLLVRMLSFNPYKRITAKQALAHPYFDPVRNGQEKVVAGPLVLESDDGSQSISDLVLKYSRA